jgi:hypothetical protein
VLIDYIDGQGEINLSISDPFHVLFVKKKKKPMLGLCFDYNLAVIVDRNEERGEWLRKTKKKKVTVVEIGKKNDWHRDQRACVQKPQIRTTH